MTDPQGGIDRLYHYIQDQHKYEEPLPEKAVHKLLFLANLKANEKGVPVTIPYFWYRYGTLSPVPSQSPTQQPGLEVSSQTTELEQIASDVLGEYYSTSLEELTDLMYQFAPYQVQRSWRELDKKLRTHHPEYHDFYEVEPSRRSIRESVKEVYTDFPLSQYPEYDTDLNRWYAAITRELCSGDMCIGRMMEVNTTFWGVFAITLAKNHRHKIKLEEIQRVLSVNSLDEAQKYRRELIRKFDADGVQAKFEDYPLSEIESRATQALARTVIE